MLQLHFEAFKPLDNHKFLIMKKKHKPNYKYNNAYMLKVFRLQHKCVLLTRIKNEEAEFALVFKNATSLLRFNSFSLNEVYSSHLINKHIYKYFPIIAQNSS